MGKIYETPLGKGFQRFGFQTAAILLGQAFRAIYPIQRNQCPAFSIRSLKLLSTRMPNRRFLACFELLMY